MATEARPAGPFDSLVAIVASAAASVVATLALFNSFLSELVPPIEGAQLSIGMVSFGTTIVLLALSLLIRKRLSSANQRWLAVLALVLLAAAFWAFFTYRDVVRTYVYAYPAERPASEQTRHIRGELHEMGAKRSKGMRIAEAVKMFGGPQLVESRELLWEESAQHAMTGRLERWYMFLSMLLTTALYVVAITVWRALPGKPRAAPAKKPAAATPPSPPEEQP
ncbi:hypothetical protein [Variovorax sp. IB41]|jgi:hypothetical protein|uniref:hypothetical protein n=1 Tax=Variovorax sp. IB41 TaxID=2779370 RepID=UPI0018E83119|nr:hypothetical protein [Variovorax sp. IB41]MBJ2158719.1 hypothetical protein [Variovorax sp. IB41]